MVNFLQSVAVHITTMDVLYYGKLNQFKIQRMVCPFTPCSLVHWRTLLFYTIRLLIVIYDYGCALLRKTQSNQDPENEFWPDLYLAWKMLHVARAISEKSPGSNMEKYKIFAALAKVSVEIDDTDYSLIACFKALAMLEHLLECDHHHIINLNLQVRFAFELESMIGDAKAISLFKSRIENLKRASEDLLADNGDDASFTEVGSEKSFPAKEIRFLTDTLLGALEHKVNKLDSVCIYLLVFPS
uniref:Predicted protein n=1 Tax=Hordeum vulgare subsp. vulgare TaxID=112509 RepID=F2DGK3_HORVV|nr:predicted protein [Hordeum vulgare subsp. vulgare]